MNIGNARYWIGAYQPHVGWVLWDSTNSPEHLRLVRQKALGFEVIDRGPISPWTGQPFPTS